MRTADALVLVRLIQTVRVDDDVGTQAGVLLDMVVRHEHADAHRLGGGRARVARDARVAGQDGMDIRELVLQAANRLRREPIAVGRVGTKQRDAEPEFRETGKALGAGADAVHIEIGQDDEELLLVMDGLQLTCQRMDVQEVGMDAVVQLGQRMLRIAASLEKRRDEAVSIHRIHIHIKQNLAFCLQSQT